MPLSQSVLIMCFCMMVVFIVLVSLWGVIRLFSYVIQLLEKRSDNTAGSDMK